MEQRLATSAQKTDFFQALRRLEVAFRDRPRVGEAKRAVEDPVRFGQDPQLAFPPTQLAAYQPRHGEQPARLSVNFFGLLGPNGALPLHLTEYARERVLHAGDSTFSRFLDVFHHRMFSLFYRAWASAQPVVGRDRPASDRFPTYVGALFGMAGGAFSDRDVVRDQTKLFMAGRLVGQTRNAEGLCAWVRTVLKMPTTIEEFVGDWMELPVDARWKLGPRDDGGRLGRSSVCGARIFDRTAKFRVVLGPLPRKDFDRMLPGGDGLPELAAVVRNYVGDELAWDVRLVLEEKSGRAMTLGGSRMGYDSWLGKRPPEATREDVILNPQQMLKEKRPRAA